MKIFNHANNIQPALDSTVVTIGTFDGMHLGHQYLINKNIELANKINSKSVVLTFTPNPFVVINDVPESTYNIISKDEKNKILSSLNVDVLIDIDFNTKIATVTADSFLSEYVLPLNPNTVIIGHDHHFGNKRQGNYEFLLKNSKKYGYDVISIEPFHVNSNIVSSSAIREKLKLGHVAEVSDMLGRKYMVRGRVESGDGIGRSISVPTANINISEINQIIPSTGVYIVKVDVNGALYDGMCNIGFRPTISKKLNMAFEVHLFNFSDNNLYGQYIDIEFVDYIRSEKKFNSKEDLKDQLLKDKLLCKSMIN